MWFKNLSIYALPDDLEITPNALDEALSNHLFQPCPRHQSATLGWAAPLGLDSTQWVHITDGRMMIRLKREERVLPAACVRERLEEKLRAVEEQEGRRIRGKEKQSLKEEIELDMLPQAFTRSSSLFAYIDLTARKLFIDSASASKAEELIQFLRHTLGSLPATPLQTEDAPSAIMTAWLDGLATGNGFALGEECILKDKADDAGVIRIRNQPLSGDEIDTHLNAGKRVSQLAVDFNERVNFLLDETLVLRRLRFSDPVLDAADASDAESAALRFDTDFAIMAAEIDALTNGLIQAFGGQAAR